MPEPREGMDSLSHLVFNVGLTVRQAEVLSARKAGKNIGVVSRELGISRQAVRAHELAAKDKMNTWREKNGRDPQRDI